jgi:hypothetical protein
LECFFSILLDSCTFYSGLVSAQRVVCLVNWLKNNN